jgi:hypothetical protein
MFDALALGTRVVVAVAFQEVYHAPDAQARPQRHNKGLQNFDCGIEKRHIIKFLL